MKINEDHFSADDITNNVSYLSNFKEYNDIKNIKKKLMDLKWEDIKYKKKNLLYFPIFPNNLIKDIDKFFPELNKICIMIDDKDFNRIHFPIALPDNLKNIKLGYKFYRSIIKEVNYISSDKNASHDAHKLWYFLLQDEDLFSMIALNEERILVIDKNINKSKVIKIRNSFKNKFERVKLDDELKNIK